MDVETILVALGCGRLPRIFAAAARCSLVVFGAMDENDLVKLVASAAQRKTAPVRVYFYETG